MSAWLQVRHNLPALAIKTRMGVATCDLCKRSDFVDKNLANRLSAQRAASWHVPWHVALSISIVQVVVESLLVHIIKAGEFRLAQHASTIGCSTPAMGPSVESSFGTKVWKKRPTKEVSLEWPLERWKASLGVLGQLGYVVLLAHV